MVHDRRIELVAEALRRDCRHPPSQSELSALAGMSLSRLQHLFKEEMRASIRDYVCELRLVHAAELIGNSREHIRQICFAVGFTDVSNFNHAFKRRFGMSPRAYRVSRWLAMQEAVTTNDSSADQHSTETHK
jgi:AraC family transcriptional regulator of arabinose operon